MQGSNYITPFHQMLEKHDIKLIRDHTHTLQINVGLLCNQVCRHCHIDAGPGRKENMDRETMEQIITFAGFHAFEVIDITGGAPELNPLLGETIQRLAPLTSRITLRSNLSALHDGRHEELLKQFQDHRVVIVASLPSLNTGQFESQRGRGILEKSIRMLKKLNSIGYGQMERDLELDLVSNPTGAFLPPDQAQTEERFRKILKAKWGIEFNSLFNFANVPLGRFREWLATSGNLNSYLQKLADSFNPCSVEGLMCRTLVSVDWNGYMYDCDFNLACGLFLGGHKRHISEMTGPPEKGDPITVADHCYTCTAGSGFT